MNRAPFPVNEGHNIEVGAAAAADNDDDGYDDHDDRHYQIGFDLLEQCHCCAKTRYAAHSISLVTCNFSHNNRLCLATGSLPSISPKISRESLSRDQHHHR